MATLPHTYTGSRDERARKPLAEHGADARARARSQSTVFKVGRLNGYNARDRGSREMESTAEKNGGKVMRHPGAPRVFPSSMAFQLKSFQEGLASSYAATTVISRVRSGNVNRESAARKERLFTFTDERTHARTHAVAANAYNIRASS